MIRVAAFLLACAASTSASAHEARPLSVLAAEENGRVVLTWRAPGSIDAANTPDVSLGGSCAPAIAPRRSVDPLSGRADYRCADGLAGATVSVRYPAYNPSVSTLIRIIRDSGEVSTAVLGPQVSEWAAPAPESFGGVSKSYFGLGVKHILIGVDHILFLASLIVLSGTFRRVLITATGFTIAHSVTLALVALDAIRVSIPAIEALIALSIVFVAAEIARGRRETIAWRRPVAVASCFGLLHGAGFAAVLGEIGLPQTEKVAALLFFNLGIEAGQVLIIAAAFGGLAIVRTAGAGFDHLRSTGLHSPLIPAQAHVGAARSALDARASPLPWGEGSGVRVQALIGIFNARTRTEPSPLSPLPTGEGDAVRSFRGLGQALPQAAQKFFAYAIGVVAAFWFIERAAAALF